MNQNNPNGMGKSSTGLEENVAGLLCYVAGFVTGLVFFFMEKQSRFVKFHAMQSTIVFGIIAVLNGVVNAFLFWVPIIRWLVPSLIGLASFILWIILMIKAYNNEWYKLPIIGDIAEKQANL